MNTSDKNIIKKYNKKFNFTTSSDNNEITLDFWQITLDVPSGCVWNPKAIKNIKRVK